LGRVELVPSLLLGVRVLRLGELLLELLPGDLFAGADPAAQRTDVAARKMSLKYPHFQLLHPPFLTELFTAFDIHTPASSDFTSLAHEDTHHPYCHFGHVFGRGVRRVIVGDGVAS
jgi:hypothetical protein